MELNTFKPLIQLCEGLYEKNILIKIPISIFHIKTNLSKAFN